MDDTYGDKYAPTQSPNINIKVGFTPNVDQTRTSSESSSELGESYSGSNLKSGGDLVKAIIAIIGGVVTIGGLIWFFVSIILSQSDIKSEISNTNTAVEKFETNFNYHKESVNSRFNQIDGKINDIEELIEENIEHP
ncbi:hypothetical protein [Fidelibacter multiformis]|uniref:hypothetical protein n=1 Tax=Fidelibacter multiformis TaxID=3377529 RepID=UPI0037DDD976